MKKLKTGILIKDKVYIRRLQKAIHTEYDQDIECIIFEDIENVCREAKRKQLDLVLIDETILVAYEKLSRFCAIAIVSGTRRYDRSNDYGVIYKFQHVDDLVANMVQIYEEHHGNARIIAFTGACGNCGTSVLAAACAKAIAAKKKKVLYIDGETATSESDYLKEADELGIACGKEIGIHNLYEEKAYARFRELLDEVKYDFIVMDVQNAMLQYRDFASLVQELVIVETREGRAQLRATKLKQMLQELAQTKKLYDKVQTALEQVKATGYGIVMPGAEELKLEKPEIVKKNGNYAVKLRASAPSIHMLRAQIETEISPMVGGEQESQQLIDYLLGEYEEDTDKLWQSNIFGKSLYELVSEGVTAKIMRMPDDARQKLTKTLGRMINENTGGMICILL